jgi:alternate signal-mediated exported protein
MRKTTKGALAIGAGLALLLGGGGTLAAWTASQNVSDSGTITNGDLSFGTQGAGTWYWGDSSCAATATTIADITAVRLVPGDCVVYKQPVTVKAVGDNLKASLSATASPTITYGAGMVAADVTITTGASFTTGAGTGVTGSGNAWAFDATGVTGHSINATGSAIVSILVNPGTTTGKKGTVSVTGVTVALKQTAPAVAP